MEAPARRFWEAQQPARGNPRVPARILARDQHRQLERVDETAFPAMAIAAAVARTAAANLLIAIRR